MSGTSPYDPLSRSNLGRSVAEAMLESTALPLRNLPRFAGAGIYAIYYKGPFPAYAELSRRNSAEFRAPIYVGKAIPEGGRKGGSETKAPSPYALHKRLKSDHEKSILKATSTLNIDDFFCRYLVVEDIWIALGENLLIARFRPIWNLLVDGFGNHAPGGGRGKGMRPRWDVLHPGREWADDLPARPETADQIAEEVRAYLQALPALDPHMFTDAR